MHLSSGCGLSLQRVFFAYFAVSTTEFDFTLLRSKHSTALLNGQKARFSTQRMMLHSHVLSMVNHSRISLFPDPLDKSTQRSSRPRREPWYSLIKHLISKPIHFTSPIPESASLHDSNVSTNVSSLHRTRLNLKKLDNCRAATSTHNRCHVQKSLLSFIQLGFQIRVRGNQSTFFWAVMIQQEIHLHEWYGENR